MKRKVRNAMNIIVRAYKEKDLPEMIRIWNEIVEDGIAFPQEELLTYETGKLFLRSRHIMLLPLIRKMERSVDATYCILTM